MLNFMKRLRKSFTSSRGRAPQRLQAQLGLEPLEDRDTPSFFAVYSDGTYYHTHNNYSNTSKWERISTAPALKITAGGNGIEGVMLYATFSTGTWQFAVNSHRWTRITTAVASTLACDTDGDFFGGFSTGVWAHSRYGAWSRLTTGVAKALSHGSDGRLYASFSTGTWKYEDAKWARLTTATTNTLSAGFFGTMYAAYSTGTWMWHYGKWTRLTTATTNTLSACTASAGPDVVACYGNGTFEWDGTWHQRSTATTTVLSASKSEDRAYTAVYSTGTWEHDYAGWHKWTTSRTRLVAQV